MTKKNIQFFFSFLFLFFAVKACVKPECVFPVDKKLRDWHEQPLEEGFCVDTLIKIPEGYKRIKDCEVGDLVIDNNGEQTPIVAVTSTVANKYVKFFFNDVIVCTGCDQQFYSSIDDTWMKAADIVSCIICTEKIILYALTTQSHTLCITQYDIAAHNAAAILLGMPSISLGSIVIANPIIALFGGVVALAVVAHEAYDCYLQQKKENFVVDIPDSVMLAERFYYEHRKAALEKVRQELCVIKNDLIMLEGLSSCYFTKFFQRHMQHRYCDNINVQLISVEQEKSLSDEQKYALRFAREYELEILEKEIQDLQLLLALHADQLIDNIAAIENMCVQRESEIDGAIDDWNSHVQAMTDTIALQSYKSVLTQSFLMNNLCKAYDALIAIAEYYRVCTSKCIRIFTTIIQVLEEKLPYVLEKRAIVFDAKNNTNHDIVMIERYFAHRNISATSLKNYVKQELEEQQRDYESESLEKTEEIISGGGFPEDPKNDDEDDNIQISKDDAPHMFCNRPGHLIDTPANRRLLIDLASNEKNFLGVDAYGTKWYAKLVDGGKQLWAYVRGKLIRNGGLNNIPREFNKETGLCKPFKSF